MSIGLGIVGIIIGLIFFLVMCYKGFYPIWVAAISAVIIAVFNRMQPVDTVNAFTQGLADLCNAMVPIVLGGVIFGRLFTITGATTSLANFLTKTLIDKRKGNAKVRVAVLVGIIFCGLCTMGGIDGYVLSFTFAPIAMIICEKTGIPRRFVPGFLALAVPFCACPGAPQIYNIMAKAGVMSAIYGDESLAAAAGPNFNLTPWAGLVPGMVAVLIMAVGAFFTISMMAIKAMKNGETFDYGPVERYTDHPERKIPHPGIAVLPLAFVFFLYTVLPAISPIVEVHVIVALAGGILLDLLLMGRFIPKVDENGEPCSLGKAILSQVNHGSLDMPKTFLAVCTPAMIAAVVTATAAFGALIGALGGWHVSFAVLTVVITMIIVAITSSPPAALLIASPIVIGVMMGQGYMPDNIVQMTPAIVRLAALSALTFETLPFNGSILLQLDLAKCTHKESYKVQFMNSVVWVVLGTLVALAMFLAHPQWGML